MSFQALIFDVDGTLAETEDTHRKAFNKTFRENGLDWNWDRTLYKKLLAVTGGKERMRHFIDDYSPATGRQLQAEDIAALHAKKTNIYNEMVASGEMTLRPGVAELLQQAREVGVRLAIATTTSQANVTTLITSTLGAQALDWFETIGAGEHAKHKKPAPDIYLWVLDKLKLPAAACLAVEDSANGLRAAMAAGLATLITPSVYTDDEDFSQALLQVPDLSHADLKSLQIEFDAAS